jgi:hypothetical protein
MTEEIRPSRSEDIPDHQNDMRSGSCEVLPISKSDVAGCEQEDEAAYERLMDRLIEEGRQLREELCAAQVAAERRRWWVIGPRTSIY